MTLLIGILFTVLAWIAAGLTAGITTFVVDSCDEIHAKLLGQNDGSYEDILDVI